MSLKDCINRGIEGGDLDPERGQAAIDLFDELEAEYQGRMNHGEAARRAAVETVAQMKREATEKKRQVLLQAEAWARVKHQVENYKNVKGETDPGAGLLALLDHDELAPFSNLVARSNAIRGRLHARMDEVLSTFRRDLIGRVRNRAQLENVVREIFGEDSGDVMAKQLAKAWGEASEFARLRFNSAGGRIPKRTDWGMPQHHDPIAVRKVSFEEWRDFIAPRLNHTKMIDEVSGRPLSGEKLEIALREAFETIRTDGINKMTPNGQAGGKKLANRRADHRFLVFKDADGWLEYQTRFGNGDPFSVMVGHLDAMARDIAQMEILGPNPTSTLRYLTQTVEKQAVHADVAARGEKVLDKARSQIKLAEDMYANFTGKANNPIHGRAARSFAGLRSMLQSMQLGAAAISAITDMNFQRIAAKHAGLPQAREVKRMVKMLTPHVTEDQKLAVRLGLIAENWSTVAAAQARYVGEVSGPEISRRFADTVMRVSGLSPWTQAGKWAFGMEFMGFLGDQAGRSFDQLPDALQKTFTRYGIDAAGWDVMRGTDLYEHQGAFFLRPDDIAARDGVPPKLADDIATKFLEMVQSETNFAVPSSSLRGRSMIVSDAQPGTFLGELVRSVAMYKNFAVTLMFTHMRRGINQMRQHGPIRGGRYMADLMITTSIMGALALQLKEVSKGRDPRPMTGEKAAEFWGAAMLQGGGLGIFGDFLFSGVNRMDRGIAETLAGPVVSFANDVRRLTIGNIAQLPGEDPTNAGREVTNFLRRYTPGGSLWYLRAGYERLMLDQLQTWIDPGAKRSWRRMERRYRRDLNQRYFWRPGELAPDRAPDLGNMIEK